MDNDNRTIFPFPMDTSTSTVDYNTTYSHMVLVVFFSICRLLKIENVYFWLFPAVPHVSRYEYVRIISFQAVSVA